MGIFSARAKNRILEEAFLMALACDADLLKIIKNFDFTELEGKDPALSIMVQKSGLAERFSSCSSSEMEIDRNIGWALSSLCDSTMQAGSA